MNQIKPPHWLHHLVLGPAALVIASLIDLYLITCIFVVATDPLMGVLTFFIFGALTGVPLQLYLAHSAIGRAMDDHHPVDATSSFRRGAATAGVLAAIGTFAWLYCLRVASAAAIIPLANLTPLVFAIVEGAQGRIRLRYAMAPLLLLLLGLYVLNAPKIRDLAGLTPTVLIALLIRNVANAGSEAAERNGAFGRTARFTAMRFAWLAGVGVPLTLAVALATGRITGCLRLMVETMPIALPLHAGTMLLTFIGSVRRTQAKASRPLTICAAVYATPLVLTPLVAAGINKFAFKVFPTATWSLQMTVAATLVVSAALWLSVLRTSSST